MTNCRVEKQEKKKVPKGRAKKRLVYIRRFVNVAMTGGKRKVRGGHRKHLLVCTTRSGKPDTILDEPQPDHLRSNDAPVRRDLAECGDSGSEGARQQ